MSSLTSTTPVFFSRVNNTVTEASGGIVGYEGQPRRTRFARYSFTTPADGATSLSMDFGAVTFAEGSSGLTAPNMYISLSSVDYPSVNTSGHAQVAIASGRAKAANVSYSFKPSTTYYIYIYPSGTTYGWWYWNTGIARIETSGATSASAPLLSSSEIVLGDSLTITATPPASGYTCELQCSISGELGEYTLWSQSTTLSANTVNLCGGHLDMVDLISKFIEVTAGATATLNISCTTKSPAGVQVGNAANAVCSIRVPNSGDYYEMYFKPSASLVCTSVTSNTVVSGWEADGVYTSGYSKIKTLPTYTQNTNDTTSYLKSFALSFGDDLRNGSELATTGYEFTLSKSSSPKFTVVNSRGLTVTVSGNSYSVYPHSSPSMRVALYGRCTGNDGISGLIEGDMTYTPVANGKHAFISVDSISYSSINSKNICTILVKVNGATEATFALTRPTNSFEYVTSAELPLDEQCTVDIIARDSLGDETQATIVIPKRTVGLHLKSGGAAVAVGTYAEEDGVFDVGFEARFNKGIRPVIIPDGGSLDGYTSPNIYVGKDTEHGGYALEVAKIGSHGLSTTVQKLHYWENGVLATDMRIGTDGSWSDFSSEAFNNGTYNIIKHPNGKAECWGTVHIVDANCATDMSGWYRTDIINLPDFPTDLFLATPVTCVNFNSTQSVEDGVGAMVWHFANKSNTTPGTIYLVRPSAAQTINGDIDVYAVGMWR